MSEIDIAVRASQQLEQILERRFGASGRGLHNKLSSVESQIPADLVRAIRRIASIRNQVMHQGAGIRDVEAFSRSADAAAQRLEQVPPGRKLGAWLSAQIGNPHASKFSVAPVALVGVFALAALTFIRALDNGHGFIPPAPQPPMVHTVPPVVEATATRQLNGSLAELARKASTDAVEARTDLEANVWTYLEKNTRVTLGEYALKDNGNGTHDLVVMVDFAIDPAPLVQVLGRYFEVRSGPTRFSTDFFGPYAPGIVLRPPPGSGKRPFSAGLYRQLVRRRAVIQVSSGTRSARLTIASGRRCSTSGCSGWGEDQFQIHTDNHDEPRATLFATKGDQNPVVFPHIPTSELGAIDRLSAVVKIEDVRATQASKVRPPRAAPLSQEDNRQRAGTAARMPWEMGSQ